MTARRDSGASTWSEYWSGRTTPGWRFSSSRYYELYASELKALFADQHLERVLELGCGDGALYAHWPFGNLHYRGIDFSDSMLDRFREQFPSVQLSCEAAQSY